MRDAVDAIEGARRDGGIADVAGEELHALGQLWCNAGVHLWLKAVEHDDVVAALEESAHEMRADEPGSAGHERLHEYLILRR